MVRWSQKDPTKGCIDPEELRSDAGRDYIVVDFWLGERDSSGGSSGGICGNRRSFWKNGRELALRCVGNY